MDTTSFANAKDRIVDIDGDGSHPITQVRDIPTPTPTPIPNPKSRSRSRSLSPASDQHQSRKSPNLTPANTSTKPPAYIYAKSSRSRSPTTAHNIITRSTAATPRSRSTSPASASRSSAAPTPTPTPIPAPITTHSKLKQPTPVPTSILAANRSRSPSPSPSASGSASGSGDLKPKPPIAHPPPTLKPSLSSGQFPRPKSPTKRSSANGSASLIPHPDPALVTLPAPTPPDTTTTTALPMIPPSLSHALAFSPPPPPSELDPIPPLPPSSSPPPPLPAANPYAPISSAPTLAPALPIQITVTKPPPTHSADHSQYSAHSPAATTTNQDSSDEYPSIDSSDPPTLLAKLHAQGLLLSNEPLGALADRVKVADAAVSGADISDPSINPLTPAQIISHLTSTSNPPSQLTLGAFFSRALALGHRTGNWLLPAPAIKDFISQASANGSLNVPVDVDQLGGVLAALQPAPSPPPAPPAPSGFGQRNAQGVLDKTSRPVTMTRPFPPGARGRVPNPRPVSVPALDASVAWELVPLAPAPAPAPAPPADDDVNDDHLVRSTSPSPSPPPPLLGQRASLTSLNPPALAPATATATATRVYDLELQLDTLRSALYDRDTRLRTQAETLSRLQSKLDECQVALAAAEDREQAHVAEVGVYRGELARVQRVLGEREAEVERISREAEEREARWSRVEGEVAAQRAQNAELRGLLNKSVERERELSGVVERGKRELSRLRERCEALEVENEELSVECKNGEVERRAEVDRIKADLEHVREELRREKSDKERIAEKLKVAEAKAASLEAHLVARSMADAAGRPRSESADSIDHQVDPAPEPLAHAPQPSRPPSPPPAGSLAAEFRMSAVANTNDGDTSWALVPPDHPSRSRAATASTAETETDEMAMALNLTHAYEADLGRTKLALIAAQERCLELEQLVDGLREQVARVEAESKERLSVMGEALQDAQRDMAVARAEVERVSAEREAVEREWRGLQEVVRRVRRDETESGGDKSLDVEVKKHEVAVGTSGDDSTDASPTAQADYAHVLLAPLVTSPVPDLGLRMGKWHASLRVISAWSHRLMSVLGYLAVITWAVAVAQNGIVVGDPHAVPAYMLDPNPDIEYVLRPYKVKCDGLVAGWMCRMLDWREGVEEPLG